MVPLRNVYYLLCYAWDFVQEAREVDRGSLDASCAQDLLARVLIDRTRLLIRRGLDRGYVADERDLAGPRGKIQLGATLTRDLLRNGRVACAVDEFEHDVLHNRLIKAALAEVATVVRDTTLRHDALELVRRLRGIGADELRPEAFRRVQLHRNNRAYGLALRVAELIAGCLLPEERRGGGRFTDFTKDPRAMGDLFEAFVRNFLKAEQRHWRVGFNIIPWAATAITVGSDAYLPKMETDVMLSAPNRRVLVETKFYTEPLRVGRDERARFRESHLYQVHAYVKNLEAEGRAVDIAMLLYANADARFDHRFRLGSTELRVTTLDLDQPWEAINSELVALAESLQ